MKPYKRKFITSYPYPCPRTGRIVFEAVRYLAWYQKLDEPRRLFAYRFQCDPRSKCETCGGVYYHYGKPDGASGLLYRIPRGNYSFWCEGEKDADAVGSEGTSHHGGAGKASIFQARRFLEVSRVFVVMDLDSDGDTSLHGPGAWCAWKRFVLLKQVGHRDVTVVAPREGKDLYDHVERGYSLGQLRKVDPLLLRRVASESRPRRRSRKWGVYENKS